MTKIFLKREPKLDAKCQAFTYQLEAFNTTRELNYAAIFHEQGLGKTKIAIDLALYWLEKKTVDTVLFLVKKSLIFNWKKEFSFHTFIKPKVLTQNRKENFFVFNSGARIILANYEVIISEKKRMELFLKTRDVAIILDESTKIKNPKSTIAETLFELAPLFKKRIIMTGTPVANRPYDLWAQIYFLDQGASLGNDFSNFKTELDLNINLGENGELRNNFEDELTGVFEKISQFSVRENKKSGVITLPRKEVHPIKTEWEPYQLDLYTQVREQLHAIVVKEGVPTEDNSEDILKRLLRLVQIASNPKLIDESYSAAPGKLEPLQILIEDIVRQKEKCIVWTSFTDNANWLTEKMKMFGACKVHGKLGMDERTRSINRFSSSDDVMVLVATPGAAKEGLTLTVANHVVFYDRSFSLDDYLQAQDRIHRISQKKVCHIYNLIMENSIDEWIDVLLYSKMMAAQLAQGDISLEYYKDRMRYDFGDLLKNILGPSICLEG